MVEFAYGNANFADIRRMGAFYVDKTPFLPQFESNLYGAKYLFFLRPRRFGKSSLLSMMAHYYDISLADQFDELFRGLWVHEHPTPEKSKYMVLHLNFSQVTTQGTEEEVRANFTAVVKSAIGTLSIAHGQRLPRLANVYNDIADENDAAAIMSQLIAVLSHTAHPLYVMIDEYDTFANALLSAEKKDIYSKITDKIGFVRAFYRTLKAGGETGAIGRVFITGGTPILLDDLMTGFNVTTNISTDEHYNTLAGFTKTDVARAIDELLRDQPELQSIPDVGNRERLLATLEAFYDGYRFSPDATERVFNSTMVIYFLRQLAKTGRYPKQMLDANARTDYDKLHALWASAGPGAHERRTIIETLLAERKVWSPLIDRFGTRGDPSDAQFVSLMYYTGMLTLAPRPPKRNKMLFEPPNRVMRDLGFDHYTRLMKDLEAIDLRAQPLDDALCVMADDGTIDSFLDVFRQKVLKVLSNRDTMNYNEQSMKMLLIGAMTATEAFFVFSEKEFAQGYSDLFLVPNPALENRRFAWLFELKYLPTDATDKQLEDKFNDAEAQLKKYLSDEKFVGALAKGLELKAGTMVFVGCSRMEWRAYSG
ncbi:MAG TPA: AAA family ATPase [Polyangium sp.]|nr:AAA family ATPase [Polyangium sp.]